MVPRFFLSVSEKEWNEKNRSNVGFLVVLCVLQGLDIQGICVLQYVGFNLITESFSGSK